MPTRRLLVLIAGNFFVATSFLSVGGLLNEIAASLAITIEQAGLLIAAFGISAAICAPTLATLGSRIDRRMLLTGSMAICALANVLAALSHDYDQLMLARVLAAVTSAVYTPQVAATVSMLVPESERAPTLAKLMVGWAVGSVLGNPLSVLIASVFELAHVVRFHRRRERRRCAARLALACPRTCTCRRSTGIAGSRCCARRRCAGSPRRRRSRTSAATSC